MNVNKQSLQGIDLSRMNRSILKRFRFPEIVLILAVGLPYLLTTARHLYWGDSAEFVLISYYLGISHPTGYPLFAILGRLSSLLPCLELPFRVNLFSAICALSSVLVVYHITRFITSDRLVALFTGIIWAFSFELWNQASQAEVYTLHILLVSLILYYALRFFPNPRSEYLFMIVFLLGLSFTNHLTTVLLLPALIYLVFVQRRHLSQPVIVLVCLLLFLLPLFLYLYLPLRSLHNPRLDYGDPQTVSNFLRLVSGREFRYRFYIPNPGWLLIQIGHFFALLAKQFWYFLFLALLGLVVTYKKKRTIFWVAALMMIFNIGYTILYNIPDKEGYYLPTYLAIAILIGIGCKSLFERTKRAAIVLIPVLMSVMAVTNFLKVNKSHSRSLEDLSSAILEETTPNSILFVDDLEMYHGLAYGHLVKGEVQNLVLIPDFYLKLDWYIAELERTQPSINLDSGIRHFVSKSEQTIARLDPVSYGEASKALVKTVKHKLIQDNRTALRVWLFFYDDSEWRQEWDGFPLMTRGLVYGVSNAKAPAPPHDVDLPLNYDYLGMKDKNDKYVALRFAAATNRLAIINVQSGNNEQAIKLFKEALRYHPGYSQVYKNLGVAYLGLADTLNCRRVWAKFLQLEPEDRDAAEIRKWLEVH